MNALEVGSTDNICDNKDVCIVECRKHFPNQFPTCTLGLATPLDLKISQAIKNVGKTYEYEAYQSVCVQEKYARLNEDMMNKYKKMTSDFLDLLPAYAGLTPAEKETIQDLTEKALWSWKCIRELNLRPNATESEFLQWSSDVGVKESSHFPAYGTQILDLIYRGDRIYEVFEIAMAAVRREFVNSAKAFTRYESFMEGTMMRFLLRRVHTSEKKYTSYPWKLGAYKIVDYAHAFQVVWREFKKMCELKSLKPTIADLEKFDLEWQSKHPNYPFLDNSPLKAPAKNSKEWKILMTLRKELIQELFLDNVFENGGQWCSCEQFGQFYEEKIASLPEGSVEQLKVIKEWTARRVAFEAAAREQCTRDCKVQMKGLEGFLQKRHNVGSGTATPQWLVDLAKKNKEKREAREKAAQDKSSSSTDDDKEDDEK